jgi:EAP30/Vps36 family
MVRRAILPSGGNALARCRGLAVYLLLRCSFVLCMNAVCLATRPTNGGLLALQELLDRLRAKRSAKSNAISADDVKRAIGTCSVDTSTDTLFLSGDGDQRTAHLATVPALCYTTAVRMRAAAQSYLQVCLMCFMLLI